MQSPTFLDSAYLILNKVHHFLLWSQSIIGQSISIQRNVPHHHSNMMPFCILTCISYHVALAMNSCWVSEYLIEWLQISVPSSECPFSSDPGLNFSFLFHWPTWSHHYLSILDFLKCCPAWDHLHPPWKPWYMKGVITPKKQTTNSSTNNKEHAEQKLKWLNVRTSSENLGRMEEGKKQFGKDITVPGKMENISA